MYDTYIHTLCACTNHTLLTLHNKLLCYKVAESLAIFGTGRQALLKTASPRRQLSYDGPVFYRMKPAYKDHSRVNDGGLCRQVVLMSTMYHGIPKVIYELVPAATVDR